MLRRLSLGLVTTAVVAATLSPVTAIAEAPTVSTSSDKRGVTLSASATDVREGEPLKLTAKVKKAFAQGARVTLQRWTDADKWEDLQTKSSRGKVKVKFKTVATALNAERFRAKVRHDGQGSKSDVLEVRVWRWIPLSDYSPYFETHNVGFDPVTINGKAYADGWGPNKFSHVGTWESKFTPGRNCQSFRGVLGLSDISADGSSGVVQVTVEDAVVYQSPALTPGMEVPLTLPIALPYRFGLQASDTSTGAVESWPAIGDPALLCTGVD